MTILLTAIALALRLPGIASRSLWLDEAWRANLVTAPSWSLFWHEVLSGTGPAQIGAPVAPLFALAVRAAVLVGGRSELALRAVPMLAGVAAVPLAYALARRWIGRAGALVPACCLALYPAVVLHGRELKPYAVDVLVVVVLLLVASRVIERPDALARWAAFALVAMLAPGLAYPAALVLPGIALALGRACGDLRARRSWVLAHSAAAGVALLWYVMVIAPQRARPRVLTFWTGGFPPAADASALPWMAAQLLGVVRYACGEPVWLYAAAVLGGWVVMTRWLRLSALATVLTVGVAAVLRLYPFAAGRTALHLAPFLYLALGAAVAWLAQGGRRAPRAIRGPLRLMLVAASAVAVALPARGALGTQPVVEETRPLVHWLAAERRAGDHVYVYYSAAPAFRFYHPGPDADVLFGGSHRGDPSAYGAELRPLLVPGTRLWLIFAHVVATASGASERALILSEVGLYGRELAARETTGASVHLFELTRASGTVRRLELRPEDLRDPSRLRDLLGRPDTGP